jgi:hypothetical protein
MNPPEIYDFSQDILTPARLFTETPARAAELAVRAGLQIDPDTPPEGVWSPNRQARQQALLLNKIAPRVCQQDEEAQEFELLIAGFCRKHRPL